MRGYTREAATSRGTPPSQSTPAQSPAPASSQLVTTWESVAVESWRPEFIPHYFEAWSTNYTLGTCPICAALDGQVWERGTGQYPPAHPNCRCSRELHHIEYEVRWHQEWRTFLQAVERLVDIF